MKEKLEKLYNSKAIEFALIVIPFFEVITSLMKKNLNVNFSIGIIYKAILIVMSLIYILFINKKDKKYILMFFATLLVYSVLNVSISGFNFENIANLCKIFSFIIPCMFFYWYRKNGNKISIEPLVYCAFIYCTLVKLAEITGTQMATYRGDLALGTKGWFYSGNELTAILSIMLPLVIYYSTENIKFIGIITSFLTTHVLLSTGTKTSIISVCAVLLTLLIYSLIKLIITKSSRYGKELILCLALALFVVCVLPGTASYKFFKKRVEIATEKIDSVDSNSDIKTGKDLANVAINNFLFNGREEFLSEQKKLYANSNIWERLFGLKLENRFGFMSDARYKTIELDIFDITIMFGLIGFVIVYLPIILCIVTCLYNLFKKQEKETLICLATTCVAISISCIAGHVLTSSTIVIILSCILSYTYVFPDSSKRVRE